MCLKTWGGEGMAFLISPSFQSPDVFHHRVPAHPEPGRPDPDRWNIQDHPCTMEAGGYQDGCRYKFTLKFAYMGDTYSLGGCG